MDPVLASERAFPNSTFRMVPHHRHGGWDVDREHGDCGALYAHLCATPLVPWPSLSATPGLEAVVFKAYLILVCCDGKQLLLELSKNPLSPTRACYLTPTCPWKSSLFQYTGWRLSTPTLTCIWNDQNAIISTCRVANWSWSKFSHLFTHMCSLVFLSRFNSAHQHSHHSTSIMEQTHSPCTFVKLTVFIFRHTSFQK